MTPDEKKRHVQNMNRVVIDAIFGYARREFMQESGGIDLEQAGLMGMAIETAHLAVAQGVSNYIRIAAGDKAVHDLTEEDQEDPII